MELVWRTLEAQALMRNASLVNHQALLADTDVSAGVGEGVPPVDNGVAAWRRGE